MAPVQLYFTSKLPDQKTSTREKELEDAARRAHAAKTSHQRRKAANSQFRVKAASFALCNHALIRAKEESGQLRSSDKRKPFGSDFYDRGCYQCFQGHRRQAWTPSTAILYSNNPLIHGNSDPFLTTPTPVTPNDHHHLRAFEALLWHVSWPNHDRVVVGPFFDAWTKLLSTTFSSNSSLEALLATTSAYVKPRVSDPKQRAQYTDDFLQHRIASLKALQTELNAISKGGQPALSTIMAVVFQAVSLSILHDNNDAKTHLQGLRVLVDAHGGLSSLPYPARSMIASLDQSVSVAIMQPLTWSGELHGHGILHLDVLQQHVVDAVRSAWPPLCKDIPNSLRSFFTFYREVNAVHSVALNISDSYRRTEALRWLIWRNRAPYSTTQDMRCVLAEKGGDSSKLSNEDIHLAVLVSVRIAVQYMFRVIYWPKPGQASIQADINDIQVWLASPRVRSEIPPLLLLYLLAVCTALERQLRLVRPWPWWHAPRFLLLTEYMGLDNITDVSVILEQFVWAAEPIGQHIVYVFEQRESIYSETNSSPDRTLRHIERTGNQDLIWDAPRPMSVEPHDRNPWFVARSLRARRP